MTSAPPLAFRWDGEAMVPQRPQLADRYYVVGEVYTLEERLERSLASHRQYFASLNEAHANLPDEMAQRWPTVDHLRKFALIRTGFRDERSVACSSKAEAIRVATFIEPMDPFALVVVSNALVTVYTARSQSMKVMGKEDFQRSKDAVLDYVAQMIGSTQTEVERATG